MFRRLTLSLVIGLAVALGTVALWSSVRESSETQVGRIAEAESYSARSQLIRNMETLIAALHNVRVFWAAFGHLPRDQWASDAGIELDHFTGVRMLVWHDPARNLRYARTAENPVFDYRPGDEEWARYADLRDNASKYSTNTIAGPFMESNGEFYYEVYFVDSSGGDQGTLAAVIDIDDTLRQLLEDQSPGYAIGVFGPDALLYQRGEPDPNAPAGWTREGKIKSSLGSVWTVVHSPTKELVDSFDSQALDLILLLGLLVSVLVATLIFENDRARSRAVAAEFAEGQLADLNRSLEQQVADRTAQLKSRTADLQTLTDSVAHDLRNPLNTISVNAQLLEAHSRDRLGEDGLKILRRLAPSVSQMADILDRLLGLSEVSHSTFKRETVDMCELVEEIVEDLVISAAPPPVDVQIADLPAADADRNLVHMLVMNLVSNAVKYTKDKEVRRIQIGFEETDSGTIYFVRDNGIGFDQEYADRLFVAFNRLGDASSAEGVGLGLTIATRAVERHGGAIWAKGQSGAGATFFFTLGDVQS